MHLSDRERYQVETVIRTICSEKSIERSVDVRKQILKFLETSDGWREFEIRISRNFGENVDIIVDEIRSILKRKIRRSSTDMDDGKKRQKKDSIRRRSVSRNSESRSKIVKDSLLNKNDDIFFTEQQIDPDWQNGLPGRDERLPGRDERLLDYQRRGNYDVGWRNQRSRGRSSKEFEGYYRQDNYRLPPGVPQGGPPGYVLPPGSPPGGPAPGGGVRFTRMYHGVDLCLFMMGYIMMSPPPLGLPPLADLDMICRIDHMAVMMSIEEMGIIIPMMDMICIVVDALLTRLPKKRVSTYLSTAPHKTMMKIHHIDKE
eukprot:GHVL01000244.1.p1 GENE.GHVL01000244.1~~GHVL01000244.1.p1  ORF type:complete len:336 (+),score=82.65 GHVL01000244.1:66-1010(+)